MNTCPFWSNESHKAKCNSECPFYSQDKDGNDDKNCPFIEFYQDEITDKDIKA